MSNKNENGYRMSKNAGFIPVVLGYGVFLGLVILGVWEGYKVFKVGTAEPRKEIGEELSDKNSGTKECEYCDEKNINSSGMSHMDYQAIW